MAYSDIKDPSEHFQTAIWTGNATARNITNDGNSDLQPDFVWMKCRDSNTAHIWQLSNLGVTKYFRSNVTSAVGTASSLLSSFNTDGFGITSNSGNNVNSEQNVAWQWKANGNSTSTNTQGDITSTIQTNSDAGFTMGTYTGNGSDEQTIGHGLGATPDWIIIKRKDTAAAWPTWHKHNSANHILRFYSNGESDSASGRVSAYGSRGSSTVFTVFQGSSAYDNVNINGDTYVFWAWTGKQGYSKFGSYTGNGDGNGPFVYTGFKPAFVLLKNRDATESWVMFDNKRSPHNIADKKISLDTSAPENGTGAIGGAGYNDIDILSNGFKIKKNNAATNGSNKVILYMAFAESPFVAGGVPTTAR